MHSFVAVAVAGALAIMGQAGPAVSPDGLAPVGKWVVEYNPNDCVLSRSYGADSERVTLAILPSADMRSGELVLLLPGDANRIRRAHDTLALQPSGDKIGVDWISVPLPNPGRHGVRFDAPDRFWDKLPQATSIRFPVGDKDPVTLRLGTIASGIDALRACGADLLRGWGVDPAAMARSSANEAHAFRSEDYPAAALAAHEQGRAVSIVTVDRIGDPIAYRIVVSSGSPSLDVATCKGGMAFNGRAKPATTTDPERRFRVVSVRCILPRS